MLTRQECRCDVVLARHAQFSTVQTSPVEISPSTLTTFTPAATPTRHHHSRTACATFGGTRTSVWRHAASRSPLGHTRVGSYGSRLPEHSNTRATACSSARRCEHNCCKEPRLLCATINTELCLFAVVVAIRCILHRDRYQRVGHRHHLLLHRLH